MRIGVPTEIKKQESRVGLTPESVGELVRAGHEVALPHRGGPPVLLVRRFPRSGVHAATSAQYGGMNAAGKMVCGAGGR